MDIKEFRLDIWSIGAIALIVGIAAWAIILIRRRLDEQRYLEQMAELEFTQTMLANAQQEQNDATDQSALQNVQLQSSDTHQNPVPDRAPAGQNGGPHPADILAASAIRQLTRAGLYDHVAGYVELHGNPKGAALLRLRNGKHALLVPHMESEAFLRKNHRRADIIIMTGTDGGAFVVTSLEQLISDSISL